MQIHRAISFCKYYLQFLPFRLNFWLYVLFVILFWNIINKPPQELGSFSVLVILMAKIAFIFSVIIVVFSFLSAFIPFLSFQWKKKKEMEMISFQLQEKVDGNKTHNLTVKLPEAILPLLGSVRLKLLMNHKIYSKFILLNEPILRKWFQVGKGVKCSTQLELADIKEYYFSKAFIYFGDFLSFFSFTSVVTTNQSLRNLPVSDFQSDATVSPKKTEEEKIRIEQLRRVEGEYLNYKKFEDADDVRRIVWKLFAKSKELMVRIPETMDPFASHIYFYASYFNSMGIELYPEFQQEMLNRFKQVVWTVYEVLGTNSSDVKYVSDQHTHLQLNALEAVREHITLSSWQTDLALQDYFKPKYGSILCIHSMTDIKDLSNLLTFCDEQTSIVFVPLSALFKSNVVMNWVARIFFKPKPDRLTSLRNKWMFHPLKSKLIKQEKELLNLLNSNQVNLKIIA